MAGAFLMAALMAAARSEGRSPLPADLEARIRDNTDDTIGAQIRELESERRTKLIENDLERLNQETKRLAVVESRLDA
jgi:hypothetical protein